MANVTVKDYKIHNLQKEYNRYSNFLFNLQNHINLLSSYSIINTNDYNQYFKMIGDLLRKMNNRYNSCMVNTCENKCNESDEKCEIDEIMSAIDLTDIKNPNFDDVHNLITLHKMIDSDKKTNDPFYEIYSELIKLYAKVGFYNLYECLNVLIGECYNNMYTEDTLSYLNVYNRVFIPVKFSIWICNNDDCLDKTFFFRQINPINEILLDNCAELCIKKPNSNEYITLHGFFTYDNLNIVIKTSQICNNFIYQKKKDIETHISSRTDVNERFRKLYLRNTTIKNIVAISKEQFLNNMVQDYEKYRYLTKLNFMNIMKEFVKDNTEVDSIMNMFTIIKLLLFGTDEYINMAGILFGLTKDKKVGSDTVSNIIYKNLNYVLQIKLKKTAISIKNELEKIKSITNDDIDLKKQIAICKHMPYYVKKASLEKIEEMKASNNEYYKQMLYVKTLLNYPWPSDNDDTFFRDIGKNNDKNKEFLDNLIKSLDEKVYGHKNTKLLIKELMGKWTTNPSAFGSSIGLVGPPGVGKTLIAKAIGEALNIPFVQITLGGQNDGEILHGHGYTYSGAQPGMVVKKMVEASSARCIMYFDELDKATSKHETNEIYNILIHMTDPKTNGEFQDRFYQEINFPLNKVIFIFSYNDSSLIDNILIDRIEEVVAKPYSIKDKINIAKGFAIKEMNEMVNFPENAVLFGDDNLRFIIEQYTNEAGVREFKRKLEKIFLKLNIDRIYGTGPFENNNKLSSHKPISIDNDTIKKYLDKPGRHAEKIHDTSCIGVINGMYATESGHGGVLPIQVYNNYTGSDEKFTLKLTGHQGKVMRESAMSAFTAAMHILKETVRQKFIKKNPYGIHIHTPNGATPKDGPSAGAAFTTAFLSRILNLKIRHDIAMTGEIDLTGKVTKIGGLLYKLNGAKKANVKFVLVSKENSEDLDDIKTENPELMCDDFQVTLVETIQDILPHALIDFDKAVLE